MNCSRHLATPTARALVLAAACALSGACGIQALRPFPDRPILTVDDDRRPLSRAPRPMHRGSAAGVLTHQVTEPLDRLLRAGDGDAARNVNAVGEVPASTWFDPRRRPSSPEALRRGSATTEGPSLLGPWTVLAAATDGQGPALTIIDEDKRRYLLRFDAPGNPRLATTACLVSSLILHAMGYYVPERHLVIFEPGQLCAAPGLHLSPGRGRSGAKVRPPSEAEVKSILRPLPRLRDGSLRAVATRLDGAKDLGPFRWRGTRPDDPNDFVPHELRRELRGLRPLAAWLNLTGITEEVPQDRYHPEPGLRHVVHTLWTLRGSLGSTLAGTPKPLWEGFAKLFSLSSVVAKLGTLGGHQDPWRRLGSTRKRRLAANPGLGWLPRDSFRPAAWSPRLGNEAFARADARDLQWGARLVAGLDRGQLMTIVEEAFLPPKEADELLATLWHRRQAVLKTWLGGRAPLGEVRVETQGSLEARHAAQRLCLTDLWRREGLSHTSPPSPLITPARRSPPKVPAPSSTPDAPVPAARALSEAGGPAVRYHLRFRVAPTFRKGPTSPIASGTERVCVPLPPTPSSGAYLVVELRRPDVSKHWLRIHLRARSRDGEPATSNPRSLSTEGPSTDGPSTGGPSTEGPSTVSPSTGGPGTEGFSAGSPGTRGPGTRGAFWRLAGLER